MKKKYSIAIIVSLVLTLIVGYLSVLNKPRENQFIEPEDSKSILSSASVNLDTGFINDNQTISMKDGEQAVLIDGDFSNVSTIVVDLAQSLETPTYFSLYYIGVDENDIDFLNSVDTVSNSNQLFFCIPKGSYDEIGISMGNSGYQIQDIRTSENEVIIKPGDVDVNYFQILVIFLVFLCQSLLIAKKSDLIKKKMMETKRKFLDTKNQLKTNARMNSIIMIGTLVVTYFVCMFSHTTMSSYLVFIAVLIGIGICSIVQLIRRKGRQFENAFLILTLCIGLGYAVALPKATIVSLDDETHYKNALELSYLGEIPYTGADLRMMGQTVTIEDGYESDLRNISSLNYLYEIGAVQYVEEYNYSFTKVAYIPEAAAMFIARMLGMSFTSIFVAGRIGNLIAYAVVMYLAVKTLEKGKLFLACFSLIPLNIFAASNYSYDGWCIAFLALGIALFLKEYHHKENKLTKRNELSMLVTLGIGCLPKPIYFPIYLICLFMPKEKFESNQERKKYYCHVVLAAIIIMFTFVAPFVFEAATGTGADGDHRGGEGISASGQVKFILKNFISYLYILFRFLFTTYFNPILAYTYTIPYQAYMAESPFGLVYVVILLVTFIFGGTSKKLNQVNWLLCLASVISFLSGVILAATAMYVAFTPVGVDYIAGCQYRYMLPMLLPMLLIIQPSLNWNKKIKTISTFLIVSVIFSCSFATIIALI